MLRKYLILVIGSMLLLVAGGILAQPAETIITLQVPEWRRDAFRNTDILSDFEAQHPGVKVVLSQVESESYVPPAAYGFDEHMELLEAYVSSADVLYTDTYTLSAEGIRAGYFLDLTPLTSSDPSLEINDFYGPALESMQWDRGLWGLPVSVDITLLIYDPAKFDAAGLNYPDEGWTLADFVRADELLARYNDAGEIEQSGLFYMSEGPRLLLRALLSDGYYDETTMQPDFTSPEMIALFEEFQTYRDQGFLTGTMPSGAFDIAGTPLVLGSTFMLGSGFSGEDVRDGMLLPGGTAGLRVESFSVSGGTAYPEMAYELVKYLTDNRELIDNFYITHPARRSLAQELMGDESIFNLSLSPENQAVLDRALENALSASSTRFGDYVEQAFQLVESGDAADLSQALLEMEQKAAENLQAAAGMRNNTTLMVATPVPTPVLGGNEVAVKFMVGGFMSPLPNRAQWNNVINDFVATDPTVGYVELETDYPDSIDSIVERGVDCFYAPFNYVQSADLQQLLSLDPFIDADMSFDKNDIVGNVLTQVSRDNRIWGYPLNVQPAILFYNATMFDQAGVPRPNGTWTITEFVDALQMLKFTIEEDTYPYEPQPYDTTNLLMLAAAFNSLPFDYSVNPPAYNFTDPGVSDGLLQLIDLIKQGYIKYEPAPITSMMVAVSGNSGQSAIYNDTLSEISYRSVSSDTGNPYQMANFPTGTQYIPISYEIGTAYINAQTQQPDACYRLISHIAQYPELFTAMPARRSQLDNAGLTAALGDETAAFFRAYDEILQSPNTVEFPLMQGMVDMDVTTLLIMSMSQQWFTKAFDATISDDADLVTGLQTAQQYIEEFETCVAGIPEMEISVFDTDPELYTEFYRQYGQCAVDVDPEMRAMFGSLLDE